MQLSCGWLAGPTFVVSLYVVFGVSVVLCVCVCMRVCVCSVCVVHSKPVLGCLCTTQALDYSAGRSSSGRISDLQ